MIQKFKIENKIDEINWHNDPQYSEARGGKRSRLRREIVRWCNQRHEFSNNLFLIVNQVVGNRLQSKTLQNKKSCEEKIRLKLNQDD